MWFYVKKYPSQNSSVASINNEESLEETRLISCILYAEKNPKDVRSDTRLQAGFHKPLNFVKVTWKRDKEGEVRERWMEENSTCICYEMEEWLWKHFRCAWFSLPGMHKIHFWEHGPKEEEPSITRAKPHIHILSCAFCISCAATSSLHRRRVSLGTCETDSVEVKWGHFPSGVRHLIIG